MSKACFGDFAESQVLAFDLTNNMMTPALVGIFLSERLGDKGGFTDWIWFSGILSLVQVFLLYFGLFM